MRTINSFGIHGKGKAMKTTSILSAVIAIALGAINIAGCDPQESLAKPPGADASVVNTNTVTATATNAAGNTAAGGSIAATGGSVATGGSTTLTTGGSSTPATTAAGGSSSPASTVTATSTATCPTCTNPNVTIVVNVTGSGGSSATATGGSTSLTTGGTTAVATGGTSAPATNGTTIATCVPGQSIECTTSTGKGSQVCQADGKFSACMALVTGGATATGGSVPTGGTPATGGTSASSSSTSTVTGICDASHVGQTFNGMVCVKDTVDFYSWVLISNGGTGGSVATGGSSATGGSVATGGTTASSSSTSATYPVCGFNANYSSTLVCGSRWFLQSPPATAVLYTWSGSAEVGLAINATMSNDGNYYFSLVGHRIGIYRTWYTRAGYDKSDAIDGADYGFPQELPLVSAAGRSWLTCVPSGCDVRFRLNIDGTIDPAGDGTGL